MNLNIVAAMVEPRIDFKLELNLNKSLISLGIRKRWKARLILTYLT
jgi:hypothetical protein